MLISPHNNLKIFQAFHKEYSFNTDCDWIQPIGVGGYKQAEFLADDVGDNISNLNSYYCELTALYWAWKNDNNYSHIGLCHYRRLFDFANITSKYPNFELLPTQEKLELLTSPNQEIAVKEMLKNNSVIAANYCYAPSIISYCLTCQMDLPIYVFLDILKGTYPNHDPDKYFYHQTQLAPYANCFVMSRELYLQYSQHLFYIIPLTVKRTGIVFKSDNLPEAPGWALRFPGFISEIFLGYWLHIKGIKYAPVSLVAI